MENREQSGISHFAREEYVCRKGLEDKVEQLSTDSYAKWTVFRTRQTTIAMM